MRKADLRLALTQLASTKEIFRFPDYLNKEKNANAKTDAYLLLSDCYEIEVEQREQTPVIDDDVNYNLERVCEIVTDPRIRGLLLCGNYGNGKTTMAKALQRAIVYLNNKKLIDGKYLKIVDAVKIANTDFGGLDEFINEDCLCIEDLGREPTETKSYGNILNNIQYLLERRYEARAYTVITTNLTPKQIGEKYGERIISRFSEMFGDDRKVVFKNGDFRKWR